MGEKKKKKETFALSNYLVNRVEYKFNWLYLIV